MEIGEKRGLPSTGETVNLAAQTEIIVPEIPVRLSAPIEWGGVKRRIKGFAQAGAALLLAWGISQEPKVSSFATGVQVDFKDGFRVAAVANGEQLALAAGTDRGIAFIGYGVPPEPIVNDRSAGSNAALNDEPARRLFVGYKQIPVPVDSDK